jgi:prolyl-tRNA synthetase
MRGREFLMKDAYSFHVDRADCEREYRRMAEAYHRIFERCGLQFRPVEAATGTIGGSLSHEFHVLAESGEDALVSCTRCNYAANVEKGEIRPPASPAPASSRPLRKVPTPDQRTVEEVSSALGVPADRFIKTLLFVTDGGETIAALVRGDHGLSEAKLVSALGVQSVAMADAATVEKATGAAVGFAGPIGLQVRTVADYAVAAVQHAICGANETGAHLVDVDPTRDLSKLIYADLRNAVPGDACARCEDGVYGGHRGIEVGHVFYLGTRYSKAMGAAYLDADGKEQPLEMGCYGIGITRTAAAAIEQNHDQHGMIWPLPIAPAHVHLAIVNSKEAKHRELGESRG